CEAKNLANASSPTRIGRDRRNGSSKPRRGYHRAVTPAVAAEICRRIASGQTLLAVCRDSDIVTGFPYRQVPASIASSLSGTAFQVKRIPLRHHVFLPPHGSRADRQQA